MGDLDVERLAQDVAPTQHPFRRVPLVWLSLFLCPVCPWDHVSGWVFIPKESSVSPPWCKPKHGQWRQQENPSKSRIWSYPRNTLGAPTIPLRQQELSKWSCLGIHVGRGSSECSTFPSHGKDFSLEWGKARCSSGPGSGATWENSLLPHRSCKALPSPSFRATRTEMEKSAHTATRTRSLKWWSVCIDARWDLARECLF